MARGKGKKTTKRKNGKKKGRKRRSRVPPPIGFPLKRLVRLKYSDTIRLDPGLSTADFSTFHCNSLFDPDYSGGGHQPRAMDQWGVFYKKYTVLSSKITVKVFGPTTFEDIGTLAWGICKTTENVMPANSWVEIAEQPTLFGKYAMTADSVSRNHSMTRYFSLKKDLNRNPTDDYSALFTANPAKMMNYIVWCISPNGLDGAGVDFTVNIEYIAMLTDLKDIPQS